MRWSVALVLVAVVLAVVKLVAGGPFDGLSIAVLFLLGVGSLVWVLEERAS